MADGNTPLPETYSRAERILHAIYDESSVQQAALQDGHPNSLIATPTSTPQTPAAASNPVTTTSASGSKSTPTTFTNVFVARSCLTPEETATMQKLEQLSLRDLSVFYKMMSHSLFDQTLQNRLRLLVKSALYVTSNFALTGLEPPLTEFASLHNASFDLPTNTGGGKLNLLLSTLTLVSSAKRKIGIVIQAGKPMTMLQKHLQHRLIRHRRVDDDAPSVQISGGDPSMAVECILVPSGPDGRHCIVPACDAVFTFDHTAIISDPQVIGMRQSETEQSKFCPCIKLISANALEERFDALVPQPNSVDSMTVEQMRAILSNGWAASQAEPYSSSPESDRLTSQALAKWISDGCNANTLPLPAAIYPNESGMQETATALSHSTPPMTTQMPSPAIQSQSIPPTTHPNPSVHGNGDLPRQIDSMRLQLETLKQEKSELQSNVERQSKEIKKLDKGRKLAQEQIDFLQSQYATARDAAANSASEARDLSANTKRLENALSEGLKQKDAFLDQYRQEHQRAVKELKAQLEMLMEQSRRTDDTIRRRAATARTCQHCDPGHDDNLAYHCEWRLDDETCGESFSSKQALQGHLYINHIRPNL